MTAVVVTGIGVVTPIGLGAPSFWKALMGGTSGAGVIKAFDASHQPVRIACEVDDFDPTVAMRPRDAHRSDRFTQMAVAAAAMATEHADIAASYPRERVGVVVGSAIGGLATIEQEHDAFRESGPRGVSPFMVPRLMPNAAAGAVAMEIAATGPNYGVSSACATGAHAIGDALACIRSGAADVMFAGGSEAALTPLSLAAFARMGALSSRNDDPERASRPFDAERDGFVFGEGAGVLVLERRDLAERRGATILAELAGYGASCDAFHVTQPDPEGRGATQAILAALADAGADPSEVD